MPKISIYSLAFFLFCSFSLFGLYYQTIIFYSLDYEYSVRNYQSFFIGLCYQIEVSAIFSILSLFVSYFSLKIQKIYMLLLAAVYFFIFYIDLRYLLQFNTHFPFSILQYLKTGEVYQSFWVELWRLEFIFFCLFPYLLFIFLLFFFSFQRKVNFCQTIYSFIILFFIGVIPASYANSYLGKSKQNPLSTQVFIYFWDSRTIVLEKIATKPINQLAVIQQYLSSNTKLLQKSTYPLVNQSKNNNCFERQSDLKKVLCSLDKPNILFLMLESFRASDIGAYAGKLPLTPNFDYLVKEGILFRNFFANGFQTKHGEVASLCSIMPSYGRALLEGYYQNNYLCLPEVLANQGYHTSFIHNGDLAFDNQYSFFKNNGFQKIIDKFDFSFNTEVLGWGYSDEALFQKWLIELQNTKTPFFSVGLTLTTHHPYDIPQDFEHRVSHLNLGNNNRAKFFKSIAYTDYQLGRFIEQIKQTQWYKNSLIFIFADSSHYITPQQPTSNILEKIRIHHQIPLLILSGGTKLAQEVDNYASQIDLAPTIIDLLNIQVATPWVGKSLLADREFLAFANRPANHWSIFSKEGSLSIFPSGDVALQDLSKKRKNYFISLANSWIISQKWLLQNNKIWGEF